MISKIVKCFLIIVLILIILIIAINIFVIVQTKNKIIITEETTKLEEVDCILILGAGIRGNFPTPMLEDRLKTGIFLYENKVSPKILVSGDHINTNHDEVNVMKDYLIGHKVPSQDIFMDHAGISTYDSIYRAKNIFKAKKIIIVTQEYHLYRSLYIARQLDIEAYGTSATTRDYTNQGKREIREILARVKDFFKSILKPSSTYLGEAISLEGNGDITNDNH